jgi:hypothetical protein
MKELLNNEEFSANLGQSENMNQERLVVVNLAAGTVALEITTPDGWLSVKTYDANTAEGFSFRTEIKFRFVITGDAKVYLV